MVRCSQRVGRGVGGALLIVLATGWAVGARADAGAARPHVLSLELTGVVDPFMASYVERGIRHARDNDDQAVLLSIDTPGGLDSSMRRIVRAILASQVPVICYTAPQGARAASAGTFIMLACPLNAMAPGTNIGAAHPVGVSGVIEQKKVTNDAAAFIRSLAERWHRNAGWAEQAVRSAVSASALEAHRLGEIDVIAASPRVLLCAAGRSTVARPVPGLCNAALVPFHRTLAEGIFHAFADPNVAFLFVNLGFLALVIWVIHPGLHVSLLAGVVLTVIGLLILDTLPVQLGGLVLLATAAVLFAVDVKAKAHGFLTAGGLVFFVLGGLLLFDPDIPSARVSRPLLVGLAIAVGIFMFVLVRALLSTRVTVAPVGTQGLAGAVATTTTPLDPTGNIRVRGQWWSAESTGGPIPSGTRVRVVRVDGLTLEVEPQDEAATVPEVNEKGAP